MSKRKIRFPCVLCDKACGPDTIEFTVGPGYTGNVPS